MKDEIQKTIKANKASTKKILHQRKFKKFNNLKYKPKAQVKATTIEETENTEKQTYAETLRKSRNPSKRQNLTTNLESNTKPNIHERIRSMNPNNKHRKQGKSPSWTFSKRSNANEDKQQQKINELEEEIRKLKTTQNILTETTNNDQAEMSNPPQQNSENGNAASATNRGQQENIDLLKVISLVEETMKTLSNYGEQLKMQFHTKSFNRDIF